MDFSMFENLHSSHDTMNQYKNTISAQKNKHDSRFPSDTPLAMAYVPMQQWGETYSIENGFCRGTVFPELDLPFSPGEECL